MKKKNCSGIEQKESLNKILIKYNLDFEKSNTNRFTKSTKRKSEING